MSATAGSDDPGPGRAEDFDLATFMGEFQKRMDTLRAEGSSVRHLVDATSVRLVSDGGEIAVTASITGSLVDVEFLEPSADVKPVDLAALVISTYRRASEAARERASDVVAGFIDTQARTRELAQRLVEEAKERKATES